ncbi:hypothetical protein IWW34DRAFT_734610 [Fusarium oxysporum f. sp. albedinis]|jgi:hypothetical protein|nr:hypothetical protein IWW34DRAFT_734610 [Fusarium oxysporum f. sp. albedinis]
MIQSSAAANVFSIKWLVLVIWSMCCLAISSLLESGLAALVQYIFLVDTSQESLCLFPISFGSCMEFFNPGSSKYRSGVKVHIRCLSHDTTGYDARSAG